MKKTRYVLAILTSATCLWLLCAPALAKTVPDMVQAPAHVERRLTSNTGKSVIEVDAQVMVPQAEAAFLLPVEIRGFEEEDVERLAHLTDPDAGWKKEVSEYRSGIYSARSWFRSLFDEKLDKKTDITVTNYCLPEGACITTVLSYAVSWDNKYRAKGTVNYLHGEGQEIPGDGIPGHALTTKQAAEASESFVRLVTEEPFELFSMSKISGVIFDDELMLANRHRKGESYKAVLTRRVEGMPVLDSVMDLDWRGRKDIFVPLVGYEAIYVVLDERGQVSSFLWYFRYLVGEKGEAVNLLPFEKVLDIACKILPLKFAAMEQQEEQLVRIDRIRLGYMPVLRRDGGQAFQLTPVWNFYGLNVRDFEKDPYHSDINEAHLTVNALDGTVIDLAYGY